MAVLTKSKFTIAPGQSGNCRPVRRRGGPPAAPTNLAAIAANARVTLSWWESPVAVSYNVSRSLSNGGPYTLIANVSAPGYTDTNVVNATTYYYVVRPWIARSRLTPHQLPPRRLPGSIGSRRIQFRRLASGASVSTGQTERAGHNGNTDHHNNKLSRSRRWYPCNRGRSPLAMSV